MAKAALQFIFAASLLCIAISHMHDVGPEPEPCPESIGSCELVCLSGYKYDENGCYICECRTDLISQPEPPPCPEVPACELLCLNGYAYDENGCQLCECQVVACPDLECFYSCPFGFEIDENNCETCKCKPDNSCQTSKVCKRDPCRKGTVCPLKISTICVPSNCDCKPHFYDIGGREVQCAAVILDACETDSPHKPRCYNGGTCVSAPRSFRGYTCECAPCFEGRRCERKNCPFMFCSKDCPFGYVTDKCGCNLCICLPEPCNPTPACLIDPCDKRIHNCGLNPKAICVPNNCDCTQEFYTLTGELAVCECPPVCEIACKFGKVLDENGCATCECKQENCPFMFCSKDCPFGYVTDKLGCNLCICLPEPCNPTPACLIDPCDKRIHNCGLNPKAICVPNNCDCTQEFYTLTGELAVCECPPVCEIACEFGKVLDENGCATCECKQDSGNCPPTPCNNFCRFGYITDRNGCDTCVCKAEPCNQPSTCFIDPCDDRFFSCDLDPDAICVPNYCDCSQEFYTRDGALAICQCPPVCKIFCEFGNVLDKNGCPTCECKPDPCQPVLCDLYCQYGFALDENNCEICECNTECPPVCKIFCEFGNVLDKNGCPVCECNPDPCQPVLCDLFCQYGFALDENNCEICECNTGPVIGRPCAPGTPRCVNGGTCIPEPDDSGFTCQCPNFYYGQFCENVCPPVIAVFRCPFGYVLDENGCQTSKCKAACPPVCAIFCEFGNVPDENGCPTCECKPGPVIGRPCAPGTPGCANGGTCVPEPDDSGFTCQCPNFYYGKFCENACPLVVAISCEFGHVLDENGCKTGQCKPDPCPKYKCIPCPFGHETDSNGCLTCKCKPNPNRCPGNNVPTESCTDPCEGTRCLLDEHTACVPNYCGGCHYEYYYQDATLVDCKAGHPCNDGSHLCSSGSTCMPLSPEPSNPAYTCSCPPNLTGKFCEETVEPEDPCPGDSVTSSCASLCGISTCESIRREEINICPLVCVLGCVCPNGGVFDKGNKCIAPENCGCIYNDVYYSVNETYEDDVVSCKCVGATDGETPSMICRQK